MPIEPRYERAPALIPQVYLAWQAESSGNDMVILDSPFR